MVTLNSSSKYVLVGLLTLSQLSLCGAQSVPATPYAPELATIVASYRNLWRSTQEKVKNTVVQVFALFAEVNMLQPYQTPDQQMGKGSGFFIDNDGHIVTNFHVVKHALATWIQIPALGKRWIKVKVISVCPERDIALLKIIDEELLVVREQLGGTIPTLPLGDSDKIRPSDEVLALGYPLGLQSVKSTTGVISGVEKQMIQMSAPSNPGSSGGPLLNTDGEVVGINTSGYDKIRTRDGSIPIQNTNFIIPINDFKLILPDMLKMPMIRKPYLGILTIRAENLTDYLGNPEPGGCYIVDLVKDSPFDKAGVKAGDMLYEINGHRLDIYGEMTVPWTDVKVSVVDYGSRLHMNEPAKLVVYRNGQRLEFTVTFDPKEAQPLRKVYPAYEDIDYEVFGGFVVMPLTVNHIEELKDQVPGLEDFARPKSPKEPVLVITHIFQDSQLGCLRVLSEGSTLQEVNGIKVATLTEFRDAVRQGIGKKYLVIKATDNVSCASDNLLAVLPLEKIVKEEPELSHNYRYPMTDLAKQVCAYYQSESAALAPVDQASTNPDQETT